MITLFSERHQKNQNLEGIIDFYEQQDIRDHYFEWLHSQPVDLTSIWLLLHNLRGITADFIRWLSGAVSRIDDNVIRCLLVKQLYDELGNGDSEQCHIVLYDRFYNALKPWQPKSIETGEVDDLTIGLPGRKLRQRLENYFNAPDPLVVIAAFLVGEIYAKKFDECLNEQVARTQEISEYDLTWLRLHTVVEADHAGDSIHLARRLEEMGASRDLVCMAAQEVWDIFIRFQDEMHQLNLELQ
ncbi:MAG: iron-containing redox enzyme family protein [Moorea sp. SIOASIH]|uniref:iron-containing redox enzyme family protein n=1 Tax=unclassified Moorena TaxID=2683338 RepID=UPI0013B69DF4|nr:MULTISPECIES: iron-containing redox enzyme family protein [unclassified Moorena]NEO40914.1 iron-containing redox enzyme family protein [Moorena sp. SIOASIH]NEO79895.1 iron-containing redox enzyme family protein [Moorena sp. SIO4G3]NEO90200.1 iron-containing redox enzyme family protein [Moorena sp. SIO3G5]